MVQPSQFQTQDFASRANAAEPGKFTIQPNLMNEDELDGREDMDSSRNLSYQEFRSQRASADNSIDLPGGSPDNEGVQNIALKYSRRNSTTY